MKTLMMGVVLAVMASTAGAQSYVGAAIGSGKYKSDCLGSTNCDMRDTVVKLYAGQRVNEWMNAEASYIRFGKGTIKGSGVVDGVAISGTFTQRAQALVLGAAFRHEFVPGLEGVARLGAAVVHGKFSLGGTANGTPVALSRSETTVRPYFGLGLAYRFMPELKATLDYDRTSMSVDGATEGVQAFMAGVAYQY